MFFSFTILGVAAYSGGFLSGFLFSCSSFLFLPLRGILLQDKPIQVCGAKLYESGSITKDQDFLSPKILLSAFIDQKGLQSELWIGSSPLESCIEKWGV